MPPEFCQLTVSDISKAISFTEHDVDIQLNMLWHKKLVATIDDSSPLKFMITTEGMSIGSSMEILNNGKLLNSQIFNNFSSGLFQILIAIAAIVSLVLNFTTVNKVEKELTKTQLELEYIKELLQQPNTNVEIRNQLNDSTLLNQTNLQSSDTTSQKTK